MFNTARLQHAVVHRKTAFWENRQRVIKGFGTKTRNATKCYNKNINVNRPLGDKIPAWSRTPVRRSWNGSAMGRRPGWDEFFAYYWPTIYGFARHRGCSEHTAEEIVQNVMLKVFQQRDVYQYDPTRGRFRDWLGTVVRNDVAEHRRRPANRLRTAGGDSTAGPLDTADDQPDAAAAWETAFENSLLLTLLARRAP